MSDPNGTMAEGALNFLRILYADLGMVRDSWISTPALILNANNLYQGFHEVAQLVAAKQLSKMGMKTQLEYRNSAGKADILAYRGVNYLYEVKPVTCSISTARSQLQRYIRATGFSAGPRFSTAKIDFLPRTTMEVSCVENGVVIYKFYKEYTQRILWYNKQVKQEITEKKVKKAITIGFWAGVAVAGTIIVATIVEDVITCGAGIADDVPSIGTASYLFRGALSFGMLFL